MIKPTICSVLQNVMTRIIPHHWLFVRGITAELRYVLCYKPEQAIERTVQLRSTWNEITLMWLHINDIGYSLLMLRCDLLEIDRLFLYPAGLFHWQWGIFPDTRFATMRGIGNMSFSIKIQPSNSTPSAAFWSYIYTVITRQAQFSP